jgi:predicted ATP-grasp superfamily ATP-dependent carboligase
MEDIGVDSSPDESEIGIVGEGARSEESSGACVLSSPSAPPMIREVQSREPNSWPPVILLGGENNALSVARSLSMAGIKVYAINRSNISAMRSRYVTRIVIRGDINNVESWRNYLLSSASDHLKGAAVFCCSDEAIKLLVENWQAFAARYILEHGPPEMRLNLLDKLFTYESASACGVAHPRFWRLGAGQGVAEVARTCRFPVILKPRLSQHSRLIGAKYLRADNTLELKRHSMRCAELNIAVVAMEFIPGGDDRYCSYYTYLDETGTPLFHFTKRILRRHPENQGGATYHVTDWNPEVAEKGLRLFQHVGLRGLGNVEFKRDPRDGELKLIEVNARYTAGNALVTLSGIDEPLLSYGRLTGRPYEIPAAYGLGLVMLEPIPDYLAFRNLNARGEITLAQWLRQVAQTDITPNFDWRDPLPGLHYLAATALAGARLVLSRRRASRRGIDKASTTPVKSGGHLCQ